MHKNHSYIGGKVYHYRDSIGLECDAVIHLRNDTYGLVEIKDKSTKLKMVLTAVGPYAYRRRDGI